MGQKAILIILDGFGIGKDSPFNAISNAKMPFYRQLLKKYPHSQMITHGLAVGLPEGVMGNSEVGHMTMGAGRIIYQDLTRISQSIEDKSFFSNSEIRSTLEQGAKTTGRVHLMGLLSDGGVHSHISHLLALLDFCQELKIPEVSVHAFLDGRDTPPHSAGDYLRPLLAHPAFSAPGPAQPPMATLASLSGRYWAMDRDQRWDRIEKAVKVLTGQAPESCVKDPFLVLDANYQNGKSDEFVEPTLLSARHAMQPGDSVVFFNYRSDRARQITRALADPGFKAFLRTGGFKPSTFCGMTQYDKTFDFVKVAFAPQSLHHLFPEWLEEHQLRQFRIAETEKYAHVTFFFNGGRESPFVGENRFLVPSPQNVATYDLQPEMSAFEVAKQAVDRIQTSQYDFILMNFANADMVGHTGNYAATVKAMEALDQCLEKVIGAAEKNRYHVLVTSDHGNAEEMCDSRGRLHTQHTLNPVPLVFVRPGSAIAPKTSRKSLSDGCLSDLMPTLCQIMELPIPQEVTGKSLLV